MAKAIRLARCLCGWRIIPLVITCFRCFLGAHGSKRADFQEMMALTLGEVISLAACNRIVSDVTAQVKACKSQHMEIPPPVVLVCRAQCPWGVA